MEDQYEKRKQEKAERVNKNKKQEKRNLEEAHAISTGKNPRDVRKAQLASTIATSKTATASIGKFDKVVKGEEEVKIKRAKRKFDAVVGTGDGEKSKAMKVAEGVMKKSLKPEGELIVTKA
ncbi:hypothetical protein HK101_010199, partial [Irineochytrium annulatum]